MMDHAEQYAGFVMQMLEKNQDATIVSQLEKLLTSAFRAGEARGAASQGVLSSDKDQFPLG
jgi:hypothetical protein